MLPVIIPLGRGYKPVEIKQNVDFEIHIIHDICQNKNVRARIAHTKNRCRDHALTLSTDFVIFHDSDIIHYYNDNFYEMENFLKKDKTYGAVALRRPNRVFDHICAGVVIFRYEALKNIDYGNNPYSISCGTLYNSLIKSGWNYKYLDDKIRIN